MNRTQKLSREESLRYSRQTILSEVDDVGQSKLRDASVLIVGTGGLGSPAAMYLAAAGVGRLGLVDFDTVEISNLHRQLIHSTSDVGRSKIESATETIERINPHVQVDPHETALTNRNATAIASRYDIVIDGTDNFATRYLVNDVCVLLKKPNCYGSIFQFEGQASVFGFGGGPCYRCLCPEPPTPGVVPSCAEAGVLGVLPGFIGMIQATEAIKIILGKGESLSGRLLLFDALDMRFRELRIQRDRNCSVCGDHPTITEPIDYGEFCGTGPSASKQTWDIEPRDLKSLMDSQTSFTLIDVRQPDEFNRNNLGGTLIPLGELKDRVGELDAATHIIVHCQSGGRSVKAVRLLRELGFQNVWNLRGGMNAYDQSMG